MSDRPTLTAEQEVEAFRILLGRCLGLSSGDQVLIISDESFENHRPHLWEAVVKEALSATYIDIPKAYQRYLVGSDGKYSEDEKLILPAGISAAVSDSHAVLNMLDGDIDTAPLRKKILHEQRAHGCRLAHVPGISTEILDVLRTSPLEEMLNSCEALGWLLGEGRIAKLTSYAPSGEPFHLAIDLGGWEVEPLLSPGIIHPSSWGNVPPGEVFICPEREGVSGEVYLNGSIPHSVLSENEGGLLVFRAGQLVTHDFPEKSPAKKLLEAEESKALARGDLNWNVFAELGLGLNPSINRLSGRSLFDEKARGTLHVALGDNSCFGHSVESDIHMDLVVRKASLTIDGFNVLNCGELRLDELEEYRHAFQSPSLDPSTWNEAIISGARLETVNGEVFRRISSGRRVGLIRMASPKVSRDLATLVEAVGTDHPFDPSRIVRSFGVDTGQEFAECFGLLHHYGVLRRC